MDWSTGRRIRARKWASAFISPASVYVSSRWLRFASCATRRPGRTWLDSYRRGLTTAHAHLGPVERRSARRRIVVIGSGFGGLAAAVRLQARGHEVTVIEKRDKPGGRAYVYEQDGFTFDGGPTVITAPWMIRELFALAGREPDDYVRLVPVEPFYRIFFPDGAHFDYSGETARMVAQVAALSPDDIAGYLEFVRRTQRIFAKGFVELADRPFLHAWDMVKVIPDLARLQAYRTVYGLDSAFVTP